MDTGTSILTDANMLNVPVWGICGGSGAGKTYLVNQVLAKFDGAVSVVSFDSYYHDHSHLTPEQRSQVNWDHPDSLDDQLFVKQLRILQSGGTVEVPTYDFSTHTRAAVTNTAGPADLVIVEGILLFTIEEVRELVDTSVYLDVPPDVRHDRRIARDTVERGRDVADVERQWRQFVEPMHEQFVAPFATQADIYAPFGHNREALLEKLLLTYAASTTQPVSAS